MFSGMCSIIRKDKARCGEQEKRLFQKGMVLMAISRKDPKGRKLREGENWRNDGRYSYRYTDVRTGKRRDSLCTRFTRASRKREADCKGYGR